MHPAGLSLPLETSLAVLRLWPAHACPLVLQARETLGFLSLLPVPAAHSCRAPAGEGEARGWPVPPSPSPRQWPPVFRCTCDGTVSKLAVTPHGRASLGGGHSTLLGGTASTVSIFLSSGLCLSPSADQQCHVSIPGSWFQGAVTGGMPPLPEPHDCGKNQALSLSLDF